MSMRVVSSASLQVELVMHDLAEMEPTDFHAPIHFQSRREAVADEAVGF